MGINEREFEHLCLTPDSYFERYIEHNSLLTFSQ